MGTPPDMHTALGGFLCAKRKSIPPQSLGLPGSDRRRTPGLRRSEVAVLANMSEDYYTRIEQGKNRNPSHDVLNSLADALTLDRAERDHLFYLAKISGGACTGQEHPKPPSLEVRDTVLKTLRLLEPGVAYITNRLGDVLAYTETFKAVMHSTGLLESETPNLTRYVFTDPRARTHFADWGQVADEQAFQLWLAPSAEAFEWFKAELAPLAGPEFTKRLSHLLPPPDRPLRLNHPVGQQLQWHRERLELAKSDAQELVTLHPADEATAQAVEELHGRSTATVPEGQ